MQYPGQGILPRDQNSIPAAGAASLTDVNAGTTNVHVLPLVIDDATNRLLVTAVVTSNALPTGAATLAEQQTQSTSLASIKTNTDKLPSLGQALAAGSVPVVLTAAQLTTLTPPAAITGYATSANQTNGLQLSQIVDAGGEAVTVTGGKLDVNATVTGGTGSSAIDDAAFGVATDSGTPIMGLADEVAPDSVNEGDVGVVRMSLNRNMYVTLRDAAGNERGLNIDGNGAIAVTIASVPSHAVTNAGTFIVQSVGNVAHDGVGTGSAPVLVGGYASAAAPSDVSADGDAVRAWYLRNGAQATVLTAAGALIGGDAANGIDVDVTRLPALVAGSAIIGNVRIDQTTPGTTNAVSITHLGTTAVDTNSGNKSAGTQRMVIATDQPNLTTPLNINVAQMNGVTVTMGNGSAGTGVQRITIADDSTGQVIVRGPVAQDAAISGNPLANGGRASSATPSAMSADGDLVYVWLDRSGATVNTGYVAQDAAVAGNPVLVGGRASTAAPSAMSADGDAVFLRTTRTGEQVITPSATAAVVGCSVYWNSALTSTKVAANASAGNLYGYHLYNPNSTVAYIQFFNTASGSVTVGSTAPYMVIAIPPLGWADAPSSGPPIDFSTAMTIAATTTSTGSGNPTTGIMTNLWYK